MELFIFFWPDKKRAGPNLFAFLLFILIHTQAVLHSPILTVSVYA